MHMLLLKSRLGLLPLLVLACMTGGCSSTHWSHGSGGAKSPKSAADLAALVHGMSEIHADENQVRFKNVIASEKDSNPRNIVAPFSEYSSVTLELSPCPVSQSESTPGVHVSSSSSSSTNSHTLRQSLAGSYRFVLSGRRLWGKAFAEIAFKPADTGSQESEQTFIPTHFVLGANTSAGYVFFDLLQHEMNRLAIDGSGSGVLQVRLLMNLPRMLYSITNEVWLEIPVTMEPNGLYLTAVDIHRLDIAPELTVD